MQVLRRHRHPVAGTVLAAQTGVSLRTVYRDIDSLRAEGALIDGSAGLGYVLRPGFLLPPLMLDRDEIEAVVLGLRWVMHRTDDAMARAAGEALAKIAAVLPQDMQDVADGSGLILPAAPDVTFGAGAALPELRRAIRAERKLHLVYADADGTQTERTIWPFALAFFDQTRVVLGWCELRQDYRAFRADRIQSLAVTDLPMPRRRHALLKDWKAREKARLGGTAADEN